MRVSPEAVSIVCPGVGTLLSCRGCRAIWEKAQLFIIFIDPCVLSRWSLGLGELDSPDCVRVGMGGLQVERLATHRKGVRVGDLCASG